MNSETAPIIIPPSKLPHETLNSIIESFILREGTDYGSQEISLAVKIKQIETQISSDKIKIIFDPESESVTLMTTAELNKRSRK
jgi:uncharacterized protein